MRVIVTRTTALLVVIVVLLLLLLTWKAPDHIIFPEGIKTRKPKIKTTTEGHRVTVSPIAKLSFRAPDGLANSAPFLRNVTEQKAAGKELAKCLLHAHPEFHCSQRQLTQHSKEGQRYSCQDKPFQVKAPCLVYSFGINNDFSFDDFYGQIGCDVFSFDPSMNTPDHRRSSQVMFYQMGLGAADNDSFEPRLDIYVRRKITWKVRTLSTLMAMLNHSERTIDMLKLDVECSEWASICNMLDSGVLRQVKQILVEWHIFKDCPARERFQQLLVLLDNLKRAGFQPFDIKPHPPTLDSWESYRVQSDFGYVNTRFKPH